MGLANGKGPVVRIDTSRQEALGVLREALGARRPGLVRMLEGGPGVLARFQPVFSADNLAKLTKEDFQSFLVPRNNLHWSGLHRKGPEICRDMSRLRAGLVVLLGESRPIAQRLNDLQPNGRAAVPGMGRAILTAILLVMHPDRYGVWNNRSQASMEALGLWPKFDRGEPLGKRYEKVNDVMLSVAKELGVDLWTLDGLWWAAFADEPAACGGDEQLSDDASDETPDVQRFGLERHLHDFLLDNWAKTALGKEWDLYSEDGEIAGYEYPTSIGYIDLLARHKNRKAWLVIELKRDQTSDDTVGQVLRYMGYVRDNVAAADEVVEGLIIAHSGNDRIRYALNMVPRVSLMTYEVDFRLKPDEPSTE